MSKWFPKKATGLNADLKRHSEMEADLKRRIAELENSDNEFDQAAVFSYKTLLYRLLDSKAEVTSKIGKKK